jgi:hypothetical protein
MLSEMTAPEEMHWRMRASLNNEINDLANKLKESPAKSRRRILNQYAKKRRT